MVANQQVRRLMKLMQTEQTQSIAASKAGMDVKTARKYIRLKRLPSEIKIEHTWRTREDPFSEVWDEIKTKLEVNPGFEAKTLFDYLQRQYPGKFSDGQLRTLQRRVKHWRSTEGPAKEVFFPQQHHPGELCQSDFTHMDDLGITINKIPFNHMIYHFVLTYSNWETGTICFSESFESLSEGLQNALWELGGIPKSHQSDRLSAAINNSCNHKEFTQRYASLLRHYKLHGRKINAGKANENGDVEQRHFRFKKALKQSLMLRNSSDFQDRGEYEHFLKNLFHQLNSGRQKRFKEELAILHRLPNSRMDCRKNMEITVGPSSTIRVSHNIYSVHSRLIGEKVKVRLYSDHLEVRYAQKCIEKIPRLRGESRSNIQYRHIIDWLIRKPGAFANYRYKKDLFPTHRFRMAYDYLSRHSHPKAAKEYLKILYLAAKENETAVDYALEYMFEKNIPICCEKVRELIQSDQKLEKSKDVTIDSVNLNIYDQLLLERGTEVC